MCICINAFRFLLLLETLFKLNDWIVFVCVFIPPFSCLRRLWKLSLRLVFWFKRFCGSMVDRFFFSYIYSILNQLVLPLNKTNLNWSTCCSARLFLPAYLGMMIVWNGMEWNEMILYTSLCMQNAFYSFSSFPTQMVPHSLLCISYQPRESHLGQLLVYREFEFAFPRKFLRNQFLFCGYFICNSILAQWQFFVFSLVL